MAAIQATHRWLPVRELSVMAALLLAAPALAQPVHRHHPPQDMPLHEKFYSTWYMPDQPTKSCCSKADCYPTDIEYRNGEIYARRREDNKFIHVPKRRIEQTYRQPRESPDGRNHICAPPPNATHYPPDTVFCFTLGTGT